VAEEAEIRELKKRNRLLEQENEVLRRAAIYLGQGLNPNDVPAGP
jgi:transposase-like protein